MKLAKFVLILSILATLLNGCKLEASGVVGSLNETKKIITLLGGEGDKIVPVVFMTSWCPACKYTVQEFNSKNIDFIQADVEKNETARKLFSRIKERTGSGGVPQILIGKEIFVGFNWSAIEKSLEKVPNTDSGF